MKNIWNRISNTKSIMAIVGAVILILQKIGVNVDVPYVNELATAVCGLLVILGIFNKEGMETKEWNK